VIGYKVYAEIKIPIDKPAIEAWTKFKAALENEGIQVDRMVLDPIKEQR